jgi:hypothetical protein
MISSRSLSGIIDDNTCFRSTPEQDCEAVENTRAFKDFFHRWGWVVDCIAITSTFGLRLIFQ